MSIVNIHDRILLEQSHSGPLRAFFVDKGTFESINRPISRRFNSLVKTSGRWKFIFAFPSDERLIVEVKLINLFLEYKHGERTLVPRLSRGRKIGWTRRTRDRRLPVDD